MLLTPPRSDNGDGDVCLSVDVLPAEDNHDVQDIGGECNTLKLVTRDAAATSNPDHASPTLIPSIQLHPPPPTFALSKAFSPDARLYGEIAPDIIMISLDFVVFYVHSEKLRSVSTNNFCGLLETGLSSKDAVVDWKALGLDMPIVFVRDDSNVLNVILHAAYGLDPARYNPSIPMLITAIISLVDIYGVPSSSILAPSAPLYTLLSTQVVWGRPLEVFMLAAHYDIEPLAVLASAYLHSTPLAAITDDDAEYMGPLFLRRLIFLHLGRTERLKQILSTSLPEEHKDSQLCDTVDQQRVRRAWFLAVAYLNFVACADLKPTTIQASLSPILSQLWCPECRAILQVRVKNMLAEWSGVKKTI